MSPNTNMNSSFRGTDLMATICLARQGKLCRCGTCTSSFISTATTVSDVSTTCPPSEISDCENSQDFENPSRVRCQPLQAFPTTTTIVEPVYDNQDDEASTGEFAGPDGRHRSPSPNLFNLPLSRSQSLARTDSVSSAVSNRTVCSPRINSLKRKEIVVSNAIANRYDEKPVTLLPPLPASVRSIRARRLGPARSDYNITPTPAIPLGRPKNRRRFD
ncbi:hypothetical protein RSOL_073870, partial [Rhizoctonia solani AG-3 Rhs1AP]